MRNQDFISVIVGVLRDSYFCVLQEHDLIGLSVNILKVN